MSCHSFNDCIPFYKTAQLALACPIILLEFASFTQGGVLMKRTTTSILTVLSFVMIYGRIEAQS